VLCEETQAAPKYVEDILKLGAVLSGLAGAGNGPGTRLSLRAPFPRTPVESRVGESYTEGSCWVAEFVCEVDEDYRSACEELPFYAEHEGKQYCVKYIPYLLNQPCFAQLSALAEGCGVSSP
jgi:hypothetical protein